MLLDKWIAEAMTEDHERGVHHGSGISSTGAVWCSFCFNAWMRKQMVKALPDERKPTDAD